MAQPWVLHFFPGMTQQVFARGDWSLSGYVGMWDLFKQLVEARSGASHLG